MKVCNISEFLSQRAVSNLLRDGNHHVSCFLLFNMQHLWLKISVWCFPGSRGLYEQLWTKVS